MEIMVLLISPWPPGHGYIILGSHEFERDMDEPAARPYLAAI
jgi:hypothetical protein